MKPGANLNLYAFCTQKMKKRRDLARNEKRASRYKAPKPLFFLVGRAGIEPAANGLKVPLRIE